MVIDNVEFKLIEEVREYLNVEYNLGSKIMVILRSVDLVEDLFGDLCYCCKIFCLIMEEVVGGFL